MPDFGIFRGFNQKLFGDKLVAGQLPTQLGLIGSEDITPIIGFIFTVDTTQSGVSASDQFKLPLTTSTGLDCEVDWGDGTMDNITSHTAPEVTHTYPSGGTYTINITGDLLGWQFNNGGDKLKMGEVQNWGALNISVNAGFRGCTNMTASATDAPTITSTSLLEYFRDCRNFNSEIGNWDVSNVTNMQSLFFRANLFNGDISTWNTSNVTNMQSMFRSYGSYAFNQDISGWDVSNVQIFNNTFSYADSFNQDISSWDTSSAYDMSYMFEGANAFDQDISSWDINHVIYFINFMAYATGLSTANSDALLVGWEAQAPTSGLSVNFGGSQYTLGSAAATARASLISTYGWTITDGGGI